MKLEDKLYFSEYPFMIIFYPVILVLRFIGWLFFKKNNGCKHNWVESKLEDHYGAFAGMTVYKCSKCGEEDWYRNAEKKLKGSGLL